MKAWKSDRLRTWIVGTAATGLLWHSVPAIGSAEAPATANKKKSAAKTVTAGSTAKAQSVVIPASNKSEKNSIQLVSQNVPANGDKTEVQRQLEALYQQDGREMPDMNFNLQPMTPGTLPGGAQPQQPAAPTTATPPTQRPAQATNKPVRPAQGYTQYQPRPQASTYPAQPTVAPAQSYGATAESSTQSAGKPRQTVFGFLKKATGGNKQPSTLSTSPPVPPDFNTSVPVATSAAPPYNSNYGSAPQTQAPVRYPEPVRLNSQAARPLVPATQPAPKSFTSTTTPIQSTGVVQSTSGFSPVMSQLPQPTLQLPSLAQQPSPLVSVPSLNTTPTGTPPLSETPGQLSVGTASVRREKTSPGIATVVTDFPNPFPEGAETEVDSKTSTPPKLAAVVSPKPIPVEPSTPKTVISPKVDVPVAPKVETVIISQQEPTNEAAAEPARLETSASVEDPYAVQAKDFVDKEEPAVVDPTAPSLEVPATPNAPSLDESLPVEALVVVAPEDETTASENEGEPPLASGEPNPEKMQKIRQRFGMKGLKGFCPVTLRDERELVDAKPEFHFTHRRQKFHFASAEARDKFEANPLRYKPAAYGADVVALSRDKDVVEGTLDFAAWYKGRLFLFSSQENYEIFLDDPTQYATIEEFE